MADLWFADAEVFMFDSIWVFKRKKTGEYRIFHNEPEKVANFIYQNPEMWLVGFNFRDYDQYILKGTMLGFNCCELKQLNDIIIQRDFESIWDYLGKEAWDIELPPIIDLIHDIQPRKSLKEIEANLYSDIVETSVDFNIQRKLTKKEIERTIEYCKHDVDSTEVLYKKRYDYIRTKKTLCELAGLNDSEMMKHTNGRVVAEALHASKCDPLTKFGKEWYLNQFPEDKIDYEKLPEEVKNFIAKLNTFSGWKEAVDPILFDLWGTPTVMGVGGLHASTGFIKSRTLKNGPRKGSIVNQYVAVPKRFETNDDEVVVIQDIGSYYPSLMILYHFMSRGVPPEFVYLYLDFYESRMHSKKMVSLCKQKKDKKGAAYWKKQADAAKLVLNTVYGCMKNMYNKLYDPFMGLCVCITGQLHIVDLMNRIHERIPAFEIVQLNTDGWVVKLPRRDLEVLKNIVEEWKELTGFTVDTDVIKQLWQRDVNNYVMQFDTGDVKAKGVLVRHYKGGDFRSNNHTIIDKALVDYMVKGVPIEETIFNCNELERFQIVLKAGRTFTETGMIDPDTNEYKKLEGKVHRIFATKEGFTFVKKKDNANPAKFPDTPVRSLEHQLISSIADVDKTWYINLALEKLRAFTGEN